MGAQAPNDSCVHYLGPVNGGHPDGRCQRRFPQASVESSYQTQRLIWVENRVRHVLRAVEDGADSEDSGASPRDTPPRDTAPRDTPPRDALDERLRSFAISAWNAGGVPCTLEQNSDAQAVLRSRVEAAGGSVRRHVVAVPLDRGWAEEALLVTGIDREMAVELGRGAGQAAVVEWDERHLCVVPTGAVDRVIESARGWTLDRTPTLCPMRLDDAPGVRCVVHGGPWTSGAIHAAAVWQSHRRLMTSLLRCDTCGDGHKPVLGPGGGRGAIIAGSLHLASRYGGYVW